MDFSTIETNLNELEGLGHSEWVSKAILFQYIKEQKERHFGKGIMHYAKQFSRSFDLSEYIEASRPSFENHSHKKIDKLEKRLGIIEKAKNNPVREFFSKRKFRKRLGETLKKVTFISVEDSIKSCIHNYDHADLTLDSMLMRMNPEYKENMRKEHENALFKQSMYDKLVSFLDNTAASIIIHKETMKEVVDIKKYLFATKNMIFPKNIDYRKLIPTTIMTSIISKFIGTDEAKAAKVMLQWDPNTEPDVRGYNIYKGTDPNNINDKYEDVLHPKTNFTIYDLVEGVTYYFEATAHDTVFNESGRSNRVTYTAFEAPHIISANQTSTGTEADLTFTPGNTNRTGFILYKSNPPQPFTPKLLEPAQVCQSTTCTYKVTGLIAGQNYLFKIVGLQDTEKSAESNTVSLALSAIDIDSTAPTNQVDEIKKYANTDSIIATGIANDNKSDLEVLVNGEIATLTARPDIGPNAYAWTAIIPLSNVYNEFPIVVKDAQGNSTNTTYLVIKDKTSPTLQVSYQKKTEKDSMDVYVYASDNQKLKSVTAGTTQLDKDTPQNIDHIITAEGQNTKEYTAEDEAGNITKTTISFLCDKSVPEATFDYAFLSRTSDANLTWQISDTTNTTLSLEEDNQEILSSTQKTGSANIPLFNEGNNTIVANVTDELDHTRRMNLSINRETLPPEIIDVNLEEISGFNRILKVRYFDATDVTPSFSNKGSVDTKRYDDQTGQVIFHPRIRDQLSSDLNDGSLTDSVGQATQIPYNLKGLQYNPKVNLRNTSRYDIIRRIIHDGENYGTQDKVTSVWGKNVGLIDYDSLTDTKKSKLLGETSMAEGEYGLEFKIHELAPSKTVIYEGSINSRIVKDENTTGSIYNPTDLPLNIAIQLHVKNTTGYISKSFRLSPGWNEINTQFWQKKYSDYIGLGIDSIRIKITNNNNVSLVASDLGLVFDYLLNYKPANAPHLEALD